jgi:hypothetical protein
MALKIIYETKNNNLPSEISQNVKLGTLLKKVEKEKLIYEENIEKERQKAIANAPSKLCEKDYSEELEKYFNEIGAAYLWFGEKRMKEVAEIEFKKIEDKYLDHEMTASDIKCIESYYKGYISKIKHQAEQEKKLNNLIDAKSKVINCIYCGNRFNAKDGWILYSDCSTTSNRGAVLLGGGKDAFCSQKCAIECCQNNCRK